MIIDNVDISTTYEAILLENSLVSVLKYPSLKKPDSNDWAEYDGLEVDLESPKLDTKEVVLNFLANESTISDFIDFLLLKTYRIYNFEGQEYKLRFTEISSVTKVQGKCFFQLKLQDDFPMFNYIYVTPNLINTPNYGYELDGVNFTNYGIIPLQGTKDNLESKVVAKDKLELKNSIINGVEVAEQESKKESYTANLNLFIKQNKVDFFKGYNAFLYDFVQPNERILTAHGKDYKCYYNSSKLEDLSITNDVFWCKFSVNITIL